MTCRLLGFVGVLFVCCVVASWLILCAAARPAESPSPLVFPPERGEILVLPVDAVDGDTVDFFFLVRGRARLNGINAPELRVKEQAGAGLAARDFLQLHLPTVPVKAVLHGREKFGRSLLSLYDEGGRDLSSVMVEAGHAKQWNGKGARP